MSLMRTIPNGPDGFIGHSASPTPFCSTDLASDMITPCILFDSTVTTRALSRISVEVALGFRIYWGIIANSCLIIGTGDTDVSRGTTADTTFELTSHTLKTKVHLTQSDFVMVVFTCVLDNLAGWTGIVGNHLNRLSPSAAFMHSSMSYLDVSPFTSSSMTFGKLSSCRNLWLLHIQAWSYNLQLNKEGFHSSVALSLHGDIWRNIPHICRVLANVSFEGNCWEANHRNI
jgi:hypothetical protein